MRIEYPLKRDKFITQKYGANPDFYKQYKIGGVSLKGHEGIDLRAATGTEVVACDDGFCQEAIDQGKVGYGKYIKLISDWGESVYAHLSQFKIKQGTKVKKGKVIALSGNTGHSTGSHLHFGMRISPYNRSDGWGGYSDPEPYLFSQTSEELDMPSWAKKLQPFFVEHNIQNGQIEGAVREWFGNHKILQGFVPKWVDKFELTEDMADLGHIEAYIEGLLDTDTNHIELISACDELVGTFEDEEARRNALRAVKKDMEVISESNRKLGVENALLNKRKNVDKYTTPQLILEVIRRTVKGVIEYCDKIKDKLSRKANVP